jgi:hypothetical protein
MWKELESVLLVGGAHAKPFDKTIMHQTQTRRGKQKVSFELVKSLTTDL